MLIRGELLRGLSGKKEYRTQNTEYRRQNNFVVEKSMEWIENGVMHRTLHFK